MTPVEVLLGIFGKALVSRFACLLDNRRPILYSDRDARIGGQFGRRFAKMTPNTQTVVPLTYRNAFLWGCANHVKHLDHEVMLLGFGRSQGTRNTITSIIKVKGDKHSVGFTPEVEAAIRSHLDGDDRNSVMLVHNHPEHILSTALGLFLGPEPLPSLTDRNTAVSFLIHRLQTQLKGNRFGSVRFYLVQNDEAAEFSGLTLGTILDVLRLFGPVIGVL
jgi:hypothetical protein